MDTIADYSEWKMKRQQQAAGAANIVLQATEEKPDEIAGDLNLANEFGKVTGNPVPPLPMVKEYRNVFQQKIEEERNRTILTGAPRLADWLRNPENAALSRDDLERLAWFERFGIGSEPPAGVSFGEGLVNTGRRAGVRLSQMGNQFMLEQAAGRARDRGMTFQELLEDERKTDLVDMDGNALQSWDGSEYLGAFARWIDARYADLIGADDEASAQEFAKGVAEAQERLKAIPKSQIATEFEGAAMVDGASFGEAAANFATAFATNPLGGLAWAIEVAGESAPQLAVAMGATLATRNPAVGATIGGAGSYLTERYVSPAEFFEEKKIDLSKPEDVQRLLDDPELMQEAAQRGVIRGLVIGAFDMVSMGVAGRSMAGNPFVEALAQGAAQAILGSAGEYSARLAAGQETDWNEIFAEGLGQIGTTPVDMGIAGRRFSIQRRQAQEADERKALFEALSGEAQSSALRNRMPDRFRDFVDQATANGPVENVFIPAERFVEYFQDFGVDPYALIDDLDGVTRDDLDIALAGGGDLRIPTATYAARIAGSEHDAFLIENMRFSPDEMTASEAAEFNAKAAEIQQEAFELAEQLRQQEEQFRTFEQEIYDTMVSRLRAAGRSTDVATTEAMLYPAFYRVMAERSGLGVDEFMERYPLPQVRGERPEGMQFRDVDALTRTLAEARRRRDVGLTPRGMSLLEFIDDYGGILDRGGELRARDAAMIKRGRGKKTLRIARDDPSAGTGNMFGGGAGVDEKGRAHGPDDVALAAIEAGYLRDHPVAQEYLAAVERGDQVPDITAALWDAVDEELRGNTQYSADAVVDQDAIETNEALDQIEEYLDRAGVSLDDSDDVIREAIQRYEASEGRRYAQDDERNLIVQHNLSAANLLHADRMRGLAVPSVAISNVDYPLDNFGEITLLGGPDMVDPRKDRAAKVFDADVYSPRYPTVRYKIAKPAMNKVWKRLSKASNELGHVLSGELDNGEVERNGLAAFRDSSAVQLQFLRETGRDIELPQQMAQSNYLELVPELMDMPVDTYGINHEPGVKEAVERAINLEIAKILDAAPDFDADALRSSYYSRDGSIRRSVIDNINQEKRVRREPGVDRSAARYALREAVQPHAEEFSAWVDDQFGDVIAGETIQTETASGDWRYLPHTLDNVVKVLKKKLRDGEGFNYGVGSIRSTVANQFKSVSAIQKARGRLIPADDMKALKDEVDNEFVALAGKMGEFSDYSDGFGWLDTFSEQLKEVAQRGARVLDQYFNDLPADLKQEAVAFLDKLANMPTEYFEAKIQRAVDLSEFKAAVIPTDAPQEAKDALKYARVPTIEYDPKVTGARSAAIRRAAGEQQLLFQGDGSPRGSIQFPVGGVADGETLVNLYQSANLSTFLHESGHYFLAVMQDLAARGEGNAAADLDAVKSWWRSHASDVAKDAMRAVQGATVATDDVIAYLDNGSTGDINKDMAIDIGLHEQWARAFEAYLMEGKSPNVELRGAFEKFRAWLISIYRRLAGLNVQPSDEIRAVMDRMLATDDEIAKAQERSGGNSPVFASAEAMGLSQEDYDRFLKLRAKAEDESKAKLLAEIMAPIKREREKWFKEERAKVRGEVEREVNSYRYYRAIEWMGNRRWLGEGQPEQMPDIRLSKDILVRRYGAGILDTLPRGRQTVYAVEGGIDPDDAAGWFGFDSGDELVRAMETAPKRTEAIDAETDKRMRELHGDALNDGEIEAIALDAVHSERHTEWVAAELKSIAEVAGLDVALTAKEARHTARQTIARMRVRDAMAANRFLAAERKAAEEAAALGRGLARERIWMDNARRRIAVKARAALKGDGTVNAPARQIEQANRSTENYNTTVKKLVEAKRRQLLNHALYMEARNVVDEVEKAERFVAGLNKKAKREKIAGAGRRDNAQIDYLAAIDEILDRYDFRRMSGRAEERRGALNAFVAAMQAAGRENELAIPETVMADAARKPYKTVPVEELRGVIDSLKNLEHMALRWNKLIDAQKERELDAVVEDIAEAFEKNLRKRPPGRVGTKAEARRNAGRQFLDMVLNAGTLLREIDGFEDFGAAYANLKTPIDEAMDRLIVRKEKAANDLDALYSVYSADERRAMAVREHVPALGYALSKWEKIAIALNTGNEGNFQRLTDERVRGSLTEAQVSAVLASLDQRDADFVQSVWNYLETFRDDIAAREKRTTGVEPKWVEARPVEVGGKMLTGGYYPLRYDPRLSSLARDDQTQEIAQSLQAGRFGKAQTRNGHLKERAQSSGRDVELDMSVLHKHVNQVIYDLELSEPVANSWRILQDSRIRDAFVETGKQADFDALETWLKDVAEGELRSADIVGRGARALKSNFTAAKLAFNLSTVAVQVTGLSQSMVVVGKKNMTKAIMQTIANPIETASDIAAKSVFMRSRQTTFNKDIYDFYNDPKVGPSASRWGDIKRDYMGPLAFWLMTKVQFYAVDVPTWRAGYNQGLAKFGNDEAKAIAHADAVVKRAQASGLFSDRSAVERGSVSRTARQNDVVRLFTALGSYMFAKFNVAYERSMVAGRVLREEGVSARSAQEALSWTLDMAFLFTLEAVLYNAIKGRLPDDDDDDDEGWAAFLAKETAFGVMSTIPFVRDISSTLQGFEGGGAYGAITKEASAPFIQLGQGEVDKALVKSIINGTGLATGLPSSQINRAVDAGWRAAEGEDVSPLEFLIGKIGKGK